MKSKVKQILSVIMTICMLSTMIPLTAYGADVDFDDDATVTAEASEDTETDADIEVDEDTSTDDADVTVEEDEEEQIAESEEDEFTSDDAEEVFSDDESAVDVGDTFDGYNYSIVMVDCGRKYYSVDSLESIIDSASAAGMHYVMLGVGNDGLRFLLKDMSLEVNGTKYSSYAVTKAIHEGNEAYSNFDIDELTERDMELIMKYAASKGVEIIPLINSPGHMDAILNAATSLTGVNCAYSSSARTIDVTNDTATAFTQALLQKYISWFASKGCTMFNMGADEYANDTGNPRFSELISSGAYSSYITYLNTVAGMIENARMKPMAFNDGIYYNEQTEYGEINKNIVVCYWSSGWGGYDVAPASWLSKQGFNMVNTHGDWYWIVGGNKVTAEKAKNFQVKSFQSRSDDGTIDNPSGAMFCIWSDKPQAETDDAVASEVAGVISNFGVTLPNTDARKTHENVQVADEVIPAITVNGTLENAGSTAVLSLSDDTEVCWTTSNKNVIMLTKNADETAVSTHALTDSVIGNSVTAMVVGTGKATVTAETATGIQHTQEFTVNDGGNSEDTENAEDLSKVTPLEIQYWITNSRLTGSDNNIALTINAADENVATENGVEISTKVAPRGIKDGRTEEYWQSKILDVTKKNSSTSGTELQTGKAGDDETLNGSAFSKVRYWHGGWQVYTTEWINVDRKQVTQKYSDEIYTGDRNQLVAYYMEVIDISNANGNSELHVNAADWGTKGDGTSSWGYGPDPDRCSVSVQVIYEDNSSNPVDTTADSLKSKTIVYGYWAGGRGLGTMIFNGQEAYEIYKVGAETGTMTSITGSDNTVTVTDFRWADNEKTVWEGDATQSVSIGNPANTPSYDDPYDNLVWNTSAHNNNNAILIKVYVRAKATKDTLTVHYIDQTLNQEFYNYNISVLEGTKFDPKFKKSGDALIGNTVTNSNGQTQTVAYELSKMPQIAATYRFGNYSFVDAKRSDDGKEVWLYYTFINTHSFVMDYGLPLQIKAVDLGLSDTSWDKADVVQPTYGSVKANSSKHILTYTPSKVLTTADSFTVELTGTNANGEVSSVIHTIYIYPASTVYYEEGFAETSGFSTGSKGIVSQNTAILGKDINNYGYDGAYAATTTEEEKNPSTETTSQVKGDNATFTFTGTGVDIYANTTTDTGSLTIKIADASGIKQLAIVDTKMSGDQAKATTGCNVPVFSVTDLDHSTYTATITHSMNDKPVKLDGFKVYNTLSDRSVYEDDDEDNPSFLEVRDLQFGTVVDASEYDKDGRKVYAVGEQVYKDLTKDGTVVSAMITVNDQISAADQKALYENGPKNEVYLAKNASLTLSFKTPREVQLGLKGVNGTTSYSLNGGSDNSVSTVDMFYTVKAKGVADKQTITIKNTGNNILSVTKLKVCDDPNALQPLSVDSVVSALYAAGLKDPEQPTATPTPTVTATAAPTQKPVQQIKLATPKLGKVVSAGYNALKLNWSKVNGANGYRVYVKVNGQWKALGNTKSTTYVHKKLETGKSYTYTVKAYKNTKSGTVWSSYDKKGITGKAALSAPSLRKAKRTSAKKATLSWKKVNGASGYVVYRKTNNGRWQIVKKITKGNITSFTDKKLSKSKKYTYTVRAYRTVGKKNIYSGYNKKGLKVK